MYRRPFGRPIRPIQVGSIPPALQRANQLMASGQYAEAAGNFEQLAAVALARNGPRAPWFFLQAGHARLLANQVTEGMAHIQQGLAILAERGRFQRLYHAGMRFVDELKRRGLNSEAQQIEDTLKASLPAGFMPIPGTGVGKSKPILPTNCPGCGGPIHSDEVEWEDELTAECPYCGNGIRAQG